MYPSVLRSGPSTCFDMPDASSSLQFKKGNDNEAIFSGIGFPATDLSDIIATPKIPSDLKVRAARTRAVYRDKPLIL